MEYSKSLLVMNAIVNKENRAELNDYLPEVMQIFGKNGGKPLGRYKTTEQLLGDESPEMVAIIEFSHPGIIKDMLHGAEFKALSGMRSRVFSKLNMMICESM